MNRLPALFAALFFVALAGSARADVAPKCKCSVPGGSGEGSVAAMMLGGGGVVLLIARARRRRL